MSVLLNRLRSEWPAWIAVLFFALLPFGRLAEAPLMVFALALPFLLRSPAHRQRISGIAALVVPLFLCFWLPMVLSSFDSYAPETSSLKSLAALRYLAAALSISVLLRPDSARWRVLRWTAFLLVFWAVDGFVQLFFGSDLLGISMHPDRLNALFIRQYQFYGPTLAMLSPLLLEYARRRWSPWAWMLSFSLILGAVLIAGMRSGWLIMAIVLAVYLLLLLHRENRELRFATASIPVLAAGVMLAGYLASPLFQARVEQSLSVLEGTASAVDFASSERVPIFRAGYAMYRAHPVNGVGVRAFEAAYPEYALPGDIHLQKSGGTRGALHAHNVVLEIMADTGTIGLIGLAVAIMLCWRFWRRMTPAHRQEAFPYALALVLVLFPVNSHFAMFGTYLSSLIWVLVGLWAATWRTGD
jgi:O-antigen ligase